MRHAPEPDCAVNDEFAAENEGGGAADDEGGGEPQRIFPAVLHLLPDFGFRIAAPVALLKADVPGDVGQQPGEEHGAGEPVEAAEQKADRCHGQRDRRHDRQVEPQHLAVHRKRRDDGRKSEDQRDVADVRADHVADADVA